MKLNPQNLFLFQKHLSRYLSLDLGLCGGGPKGSHQFIKSYDSFRSLRTAIHNNDRDQVDTISTEPFNNDNDDNGEIWFGEIICDAKKQERQTRTPPPPFRHVDDGEGDMMIDSDEFQRRRSLHEQRKVLSPKLVESKTTKAKHLLHLKKETNDMKNNQVFQINPLDPLGFLEDDPKLTEQELKRIPHMSLKPLIALIENAAETHVTSLPFWSSISERCQNLNEEMTSIDAHHILKSFYHIQLFDKELWGALCVSLQRHLSKLHAIQLVNILKFYEFGNLRPERLYIGIMNALIQCNDSMDGYEFAEVLKTLAELKMANSQLLSEMARSIAKHLNLLSFSQGCLISGSLRSLGVQSTPFFLLLDDRLETELKMMTLQETIDALKELNDLPFSWKPTEDSLKNELNKRLKSFKKFSQIEELSDPFDTLDYLRKSDLLTNEFIKCLCDWCCHTAALLPTRSNKKPEAHQLLILAEIVRNRKLGPIKSLNNAIQKFVVAEKREFVKIGTPPIGYVKNRIYMKAKDPFLDLNITVPKVETPSQQLDSLMARSQLYHHRVLRIPPGLTVPDHTSLDQLKEMKHVGALWSAVSHSVDGSSSCLHQTIGKKERVSLQNKTVRWTQRAPRTKEENTAVPGYDRPATKPFKMPFGWL